MLKDSPDLILKKKIARLTLKWCKNKFGVNSSKKIRIKIELRLKIKKDGNFIVFGHYYSDINTIYIYNLRNVSTNDLVSTVIHEYTHYLQSDTKYLEYLETYDYDNHPYECEARKNEKDYTEMCLNEILTLINN